VIAFRNIFEGSIRDHAVVTFKDATTPGPLRPRQRRDWKLEACPASRPQPRHRARRLLSRRLVHRRQGAQGALLCTRADSADSAFGPPRARVFARPPHGAALPAADGRALHLVWKEFDGIKAQVRWQVSRRRRPWLERARTVAETTTPRINPLLVAMPGASFLSWLTKVQGYRLIPLEEPAMDCRSCLRCC